MLKMFKNNSLEEIRILKKRVLMKNFSKFRDELERVKLKITQDLGKTTQNEIKNTNEQN
jgi:hypothetical protein